MRDGARVAAGAIGDRMIDMVALAILMLTLAAYERGEAAMATTSVEAWIAPYRVARL